MREFVITVNSAKRMAEREECPCSSFKIYH